MRMEMRRALRMANQAIRAKSICPVCGKPKDGFQMVTGGRWVGTGDDMRSMGECVQSREEAGLCICDGKEERR